MNWEFAIGSAVTLAAVWLGSILARSNEARNWRRDRSLEAFSDLMRASDIVRDEATVIRTMEIGTAEHAAKHKVLVDAVAEMYRLADRVSLLGGKLVRDSATTLTLHCGKLSEEASKTPKPSDEEWKELTSLLANLYSNFRAYARDEVQPRHWWTDFLARIRARLSSK